MDDESNKTENFILVLEDLAERAVTVDTRVAVVLRSLLGTIKYEGATGHSQPLDAFDEFAFSMAKVMSAEINRKNALLEEEE